MKSAIKTRLTLVISLMVGGILMANSSISSSPVYAVTLFGNYPPTDDLNSSPLSSTRRQATGFTLSTGNDYSLDLVTLRLGNFEIGDVAQLEVYADPVGTSTSNNPNGSILQLITFANPTTDGLNNFNFTPTSTFTFRAATRYWLVVNASVGGFNWLASLNGVNPTGPVNFTSNGFRISTDSGSNYGESFLRNSFTIEGTLVNPIPFEFNPCSGIIGLGGIWLGIRSISKLKNRFSIKD
jgi:hypothetical protein